MRFFYAIVITIVPLLAFAQEKLTIQGSVTNDAGEPLANATIIIKPTNTTTITKANGFFSIQTTAAANLSLQVQYVGYKTYTKKITTNKSSTVEANIILDEQDTTTLQQVEILGRKQKSYKNDYSFAGSKVAMRTKDIPQSISVVTKELMDDRQIFRLNDIGKATTGVNQFSANNDLTIRGFRASEEARLINGLRSGQFFFTQPITVNLERVEVIKGPASALFGNAQPGGTVNMVTKKPLAFKRQAANVTVGSFNTFRSALDFTGPLNQEKTLLYRFNVGYENAGSFRDLQGGEVYMIAPSLTFLPSPKTSVNADLVLVNNNTKLDRGQAVFGAVAGVTNLQSTPINLALAATNDHYRVQDLSVTLSLSHKFSENFTFNASYMKFRWSEDLAEHRTSNAYAVDTLGQTINTMAGMQVFLRQQQIITDNIATYFSYKFTTGLAEHTLVAGLDYLQQVRPVGGSQLTASGYRNRTNTAASAYNRANGANFSMTSIAGVRAPVPNVPHFDLTNAGGYGFRLFSNYLFTNAALAATKFTSTGGYVQHLVKYKKWQALVGARYETYTDVVRYRTGNDSNVVQLAFIPRIGLTYALTKNINIYGTYAQGYMPQVAATLSNPNAGGPFDPLTSKLIEAGAKGEFFNQRLLASVAIYQLQQTNVLVPDPQPGNPDFRRQRGLQEAKGVELEATGYITNNLSISMGYAYNDAKIVDDIATVKGLVKENAPLHNGNLWLKYHAKNGRFNGLGIAAGINHVSERSPSLTRTFIIPAYTLIDAAVYYQYNKYKLSVNFNNITNQKHWVGGYDFLRMFPGAPRNVLFSFGYIL
ncbi:MAG: TonB-dependent receptor [Bacteroidetes bacterium]|nr:MAG: TonB-dependent receptor [Bacteroidota bacterium]TAE72562.1 MAG: TonB-dependent receptor [Bacteroidota bacterium]TAF91138.1 MAG: TonB-dependent receptor [Bacteroidota bacterium]